MFLYIQRKIMRVFFVCKKWTYVWQLWNKESPPPPVKLLKITFKKQSLWKSTQQIKDTTPAQENLGKFTKKSAGQCILAKADPAHLGGSPLQAGTQNNGLLSSGPRCSVSSGGHAFSIPNTASAQELGVTSFWTFSNKMGPLFWTGHWEYQGPDHSCPAWFHSRRSKQFPSWPST